MTKRRKRKALRKEDQVRMRVTPSQKRKLERAAAESGLGVGTWLRATALREAAKVLGR